MTYEEVIGIEAVKERFMGNYQMFSMYLYQFAEGELFHKLEQLLKIGDLPGAFDVAHDMKGVILNLSLKLLEEPILPIVENLREGKTPDKKSWECFADGYTQTVEVVGRLKAQTPPVPLWGTT